VVWVLEFHRVGTFGSNVIMECIRLLIVGLICAGLVLEFTLLSFGGLYYVICFLQLDGLF